MRHAAILLSALALDACTVNSLDAPIVSGGPIRPGGRAAIGQPTQVGRLVVTPQAIVEDSRCPINARCVWAGRLTITARIDGAGWRDTRNLTLGEPLALRGTSVTLVAGEPGKLAGGPAVPPEAYTFAFQGGL